MSSASRVWETFRDLYFDNNVKLYVPSWTSHEFCSALCHFTNCILLLLHFHSSRSPNGAGFHSRINRSCKISILKSTDSALGNRQEEYDIYNSTSVIKVVTQRFCQLFRMSTAADRKCPVYLLSQRTHWNYRICINSILLLKLACRIYLLSIELLE
jgi:hypothetical protein